MTRIPLLLAAFLLLLGCGTDEPDGPAVPSVDRTELLTHWADNVIVPAFQDYAAAADRLHIAAEAFAADPRPETERALQSEFEEAYVSWQYVSPFMTGPGEDLRLLEQTNIYPTDTTRVLDADVNLELPSNADIQGFPAIDYLIYGSRPPAQHPAALTARTARLADLAGRARDAWTDDYRQVYLAASGSNATASVDRTVNDFIFWYEKHLRAGKVGIPAGVFSSGPAAGRAEAPYHGQLSHRLLVAGLRAAAEFLSTEPGLLSSLDALGVERDGQLLSSRIEGNFALADAAADALDADLATQVRTDNAAMLQLYDVLQRNVILLKVDMLQALNINVDYVDADGD